MFITQRSTPVYFLTFSEQTLDHIKKPLKLYQLYHIVEKSFMSAKYEEANEGYYTVTQYLTVFGLHTCNMNVCEVVSESMLFPHNHVLTLVLPAFCSAAPTLVIHLRPEYRVHVSVR